MTRYVIDPGVAMRLAERRVVVAEEIELLAPTLFRSQVLASLFAAVRNGELTKHEADTRIAYVRDLRMRLLGDRVLQDVAWKLAAELGWPDTYDAEYVALTRLQADALVTLDRPLARAVRDVVPTASFDELM